MPNQLDQPNNSNNSNNEINDTPVPITVSTNFDSMDPFDIKNSINSDPAPYQPSFFSKPCSRPWARVVTDIAAGMGTLISAEVLIAFVDHVGQGIVPPEFYWVAAVIGAATGLGASEVAQWAMGCRDNDEDDDEYSSMSYA